MRKTFWSLLVIVLVQGGLLLAAAQDPPQAPVSVAEPETIGEVFLLQQGALVALKPESANVEILSNVVDGAGQAARCSISSPSLNFFPSKTWTISSEPLSLRQRASA